ncbi:MAG: hypothetical protein ACI8XD_000243, partial [Thermoproteota archaeon]
KSASESGEALMTPWSFMRLSLTRGQKRGYPNKGIRLGG